MLNKILTERERDEEDVEQRPKKTKKKRCEAKKTQQRRRGKIMIREVLDLEI